MAFKGRGTLNPHGAPVLKRVIAANSIVVTELDSIKFASGFAALGTTGALVAGHVTALSNRAGVGLETTGVAGAETGSFAGTFTMSSSNQTVAKVKVELDISKNTLYAASMDATPGTTTGSNLIGYHMDLDTEEELDESTAATTTAQYATWGLDSEDATKAIVNIYESVIFGV